MPESLLLRVLGSRKSVLFVEGDNASLDRRIYSQIYQEWSVTPCGSCEHVIHAVGVFSSLSEFHHLNVRGLIDDDERPKSEAEALQKAGVWLLGYTEIENILLTEDVLHIAASELLIEDGHTIVGRAKETILKHFNTERDMVIARRVARRLQQAARYFQTKARTEAELKAAWDGLHSSVDSSSIFVEEAKRIDAVIASNNYEQAIRLYANKGLFRAITGMFGTINLQNYLCNLLASSKGEHLRSALRQQLPTIM